MKIKMIICLLLLNTGILAQEKKIKHELGFKYEMLSGRPSLGIIYQYRFSPKFRLSSELEYGGYRLSLNDGGWNFGKVSFDIQRLWQLNSGFNFYAGLGASHSLTHINNLGNMTLYQSLGFGPLLGFEYDFSKHQIPIILGAYSKFHFQKQLNSLNQIGTSLNFGLNLKYTF